MQFKGDRRPSTPEIARILNVDAIVEGSVLRAGDKVRITAQLIDARADKHLWARSFERNSRDVLALQDELASAIAGEIQVQLTPMEKSRLTAAPTVNPEAHDAYLKGRYFFNRPSDENLQKAIAVGYGVNESAGFGSNTPQDPRHIGQSRGRSAIDQRHRFVLSRIVYAAANGGIRSSTATLAKRRWPGWDRRSTASSLKESPPRFLSLPASSGTRSSSPAR